MMVSKALFRKLPVINRIGLQSIIQIRTYKESSKLSNL